MFRIPNSIRFYHRLLLLLLPVFCIGLFPIIFFRVNLRTMCAAERERAITQLRSVIESTGGKPSDEQLLNFERSYPKTKVAALARFLRAYLHFPNSDYAGARRFSKNRLSKKERNWAITLSII